MARHVAWMESRYLSPYTIRARKVALRSLGLYLGGPVLYATADDINGWMRQESSRIGQSSMRTYLGNLREFYKWCLADQLILVDPTAKVRGPSSPRYLPRPLSDEDFARAMDTPHTDLRVMLALAGWGGLRAGEIARLAWPDVDVRRRTMRLLGKGRKERMMYVADDLLDVLDELRDRRGPVIRRRDGSEGHVAPWRISHLANHHLHSIGITESLHSLRHRFGTRLLEESGGDLRLVQDAMGHSSPATTAGYTRVRPSRMQDAVQKASRLDLPPVGPGALVAPSVPLLDLDPAPDASAPGGGDGPGEVLAAG